MPKAYQRRKANYNNKLLILSSTIGVQISAVARIFRHHIHTHPKTHAAPYAVGTQVLSPKVKRPKHEADHSHRVPRLKIA